MPARKLPDDVPSLGLILTCVQSHLDILRPLHDEVRLAEAGFEFALSLGEAETVAKAWEDFHKAVSTMADVETPLSHHHRSLYAEAFLDLAWRGADGRDSAKKKREYLSYREADGLQELSLRCRIELRERFSSWEDLHLRVTCKLGELARATAQPNSSESPEQARDRACFEARKAGRSDKATRKLIEAQPEIAPLGLAKNAVQKACDRHSKRLGLPELRRKPRRGKSAL